MELAERIASRAAELAGEAEQLRKQLADAEHELERLVIAGQVTRVFTVSWTNNVSERGAKAARRHQAVSGYWHSLATLARWCRLRSYLDSAAAHGVTALDAIRSALEGKPWLPPLPAIS